MRVIINIRILVLLRIVGVAVLFVIVNVIVVRREMTRCVPGRVLRQSCVQISMLSRFKFSAMMGRKRIKIIMLEISNMSNMICVKLYVILSIYLKYLISRLYESVPNFSYFLITSHNH